MPTYDYFCNCCGSRFSKFVSVSEKNKVRCSGCGCGDITQVFSAFNFFSKGGGHNYGSNNKGCSGRNCSSCPGC